MAAQGARENVSPGPALALDVPVRSYVFWPFAKFLYSATVH